MQKKRVMWLGAVLVIMLVLVIAKESMYSGESIYKYSSDIALQTNEATSTSKASSQAQSLSKTSAESGTPVVKKTPQELCVEQKTKELKEQGITYQRGSLLVTFAKTVSWTQGKEILAEYNVAYSPQTEAQGGFSTKTWVEVRVPDGQELPFLCRLQTNADIKYVGVNQIFQLHE